MQQTLVISQGLQRKVGTSDTTRAICGGGMTTSNDVFTNEIQYFTMATTGECNFISVI